MFLFTTSTDVTGVPPSDDESTLSQLEGVEELNAQEDDRRVEGRRRHVEAQRARELHIAFLVGHRTGTTVDRIPQGRKDAFAPDPERLPMRVIKIELRERCAAVHSSRALTIKRGGPSVRMRRLP